MHFDETPLIPSQHPDQRRNVWYEVINIKTIGAFNGHILPIAGTWLIHYYMAKMSPIQGKMDLLETIAGHPVGKDCKLRGEKKKKGKGEKTPY